MPVQGVVKKANILKILSEFLFEHTNLIRRKPSIQLRLIWKGRRGKGKQRGGGGKQRGGGEDHVWRDEDTVHGITVSSEYAGGRGMLKSEYSILSLQQKLAIGISVGFVIFFVIFVVVGILEMLDRKNTAIRKKLEADRCENLEKEFRMLFKNIHADNQVTKTPEGVMLDVPDFESQTSLNKLHTKRLKSHKKVKKRSHVPKRRASKRGNRISGEFLRNDVTLASVSTGAGNVFDSKCTASDNCVDGLARTISRKTNQSDDDFGSVELPAAATMETDT
ncbi:hypothetical protein CAPTEDRAFT_188695 [Capitella teleta]|uniref:Uncharacterized protein n=1 Tax=Capitella teleta TaxID=283909 RepID=R7T647_CAPTE|nr:hypothetical protein CAPTEDRAFT_188695 [Capitella teleta]|eukprot:ELT88984.1 hypothetical protein CAPTEDRAFT_188695 [Capitella teleta]